MVRIRRMLMVGPLLAAIFAVSPAQAACEMDGSIPDTTARVIPVNLGAATIYIDDRDYADLDGDGTAGGIWLYLESNGIPGRQFGQYQVAFTQIPGSAPAAPDSTVQIVRQGGESRTVTLPPGQTLPAAAQNRRVNASNGTVLITTGTNTVTVTLFAPRGQDGNSTLSPDDNKTAFRPNEGGYRIPKGAVFPGGPLGAGLATSTGFADPCYVSGVGDTIIF